jgi:hypothetical protein
MADLAIKTALLALLLHSVVAPIADGAENLLQNPNADLYSQHWRTSKDASIEEVGGNRCFVVRNGGGFTQEVFLPEGAQGKYVLLIGRGSSERINPDGSITGLPYLYGYLMTVGTTQDVRILGYLQGQQMRCSATAVNEWAKMWGVYQVPEGAGKVQFMLAQGLRRGEEYNGSAARFDDLGLYLFSTESEAEEFARQYRLDR